MDEIVKLAMAKWPRVPHCYGWLALDARGNWRMRDEAAQALGLAGEPIRHAALLAFINRNYAVDERGCWYFQNGPQRVYLNLALTPYIARLDPAQGMLLQTSHAITTIDQAWLSDQGRLIFQSGSVLASLDDRDWVSCVEQLRLDGEPLTEEAFTDWLGNPSQSNTPAPPNRQLCWQWQQQTLVLGTMVEAELGARFGFQTRPQA